MSYTEKLDRKSNQFTHLAICNIIFGFLIVYYCLSEVFENWGTFTISDRSKDVLAGGFGVSLFYFLVLGLKMLTISLLDEVTEKFEIKSKQD